jgi:hypothetical protein
VAGWLPQDRKQNQQQSARQPLRMCVPVIELVVNALRVALLLCIRQRLLLGREG